MTPVTGRSAGSWQRSTAGPIPGSACSPTRRTRWPSGSIRAPPEGPCDAWYRGLSGRGDGDQGRALRDGAAALEAQEAEAAEAAARAERRRPADGGPEPLVARGEEGHLRARGLGHRAAIASLQPSLGQPGEAREQLDATEAARDPVARSARGAGEGTLPQALTPRARRHPGLRARKRYSSLRSAKPSGCDVASASRSRSRNSAWRGPANRRTHSTVEM